MHNTQCKFDVNHVKFCAVELSRLLESNREKFGSLIIKILQQICFVFSGSTAETWTDGWDFFSISDSSRRRGIVGFKSHRTAPPTEFANQPGFFAIQPFALVWNISRQILPEYLHPYLPLLLHHLWNCTTGHCK